MWASAPRVRIEGAEEVLVKGWGRVFGTMVVGDAVGMSIILEVVGWEEESSVGID